MIFTGSTPVGGNQAGISCPVGTLFSPLHPTLSLLTCNVHCFKCYAYHVVSLPCQTFSFLIHRLMMIRFPFKI